jgi:hypothetical protein
MGDISRYKGGACKKMATGGAVQAAPVRRGTGQSRLEASARDARVRQSGRDYKGSNRGPVKKMAIGGQVQTPNTRPPMPMGIAAMPAPMARPPMPMQQMKRGGKVKGGC